MFCLVNNKGDKNVCCTEYYSNIVHLQQIIYRYIVFRKTNVVFGKTGSFCLETHVQQKHVYVVVKACLIWE